MGSGSLDERVGRLEDDFRTILKDVNETRSKVERLDANVSRLDAGVSELNIGMKQLLDRDRGRPEPLSWGKIGAASATTIVTLLALWGLITQVVDYASVKRHEAIDKRLTEIEHQLRFNTDFVNRWNENGRLLFLERSVARLEQSAAWVPTVKR